ncbi:SIR2 family protein [Enterococcus sp.]|uniref:SIR2 family protein n=1 Tax=Enterococcus sp. TaxID=35783 RepID=UPI00291319E7|nr:SIR2 family protein [Enterococcus sp.]MDU5337223.1 SIR2 family protein [Enterococcus sp.]
MNQKVKELLNTVLTEKNITFLLGAGASAPFFSSLGNLENVLTYDGINENGKRLIKSIFYNKSISKNEYLLEYLKDELSSSDSDTEKQMLSILFQYKRFIHNILEYLKVRNSRVSPKRANIITTNYDLFIEAAIDDILEDNPRVHFNDGTNGYIKRILQTDNFNKTLLYSGIFDNYSNEMPTINLIKCHGSVNWKEYSSLQDSKKRIQIQMTTDKISELNQMIDSLFDEMDSFLAEEEENLDYLLLLAEDVAELLDDEEPESIKGDINLIGDSFEVELLEISKKMEQIQIVYPTKKKFESTLVNEYYFGLLRLLSYELEKEQSTLVVFGFSFYDEHITEIVQRSLNNPNLLVIIFCYTNDNRDTIISNFNFTDNSIPNNVQFVMPNDFVLEEIDTESYKKKYDDIKMEKSNIIYGTESVTVFDEIVSFVKTEKKNEYCILDFNSLNTILESEISNKYLDKNFLDLVNEDGDYFG